MIGEYIRSAFRDVSSYAETALNETTIRVAVTGLSRAGKTVFLTSLIHNLVALGRRLNTLPALRNHLEAASGSRDEIARVVGRVGAQRDGIGAVAARLDQGDRGEPLGMARGARRHGIEDQPVAVLHQRVAHEAQPGFLAAARAEQPGVGVGGRGMGVVPAPLAVKIARGIASRAGRVPAPSSGGSSSGWPRLPARCRRPRNARPTTTP
jgi:hypothetical protein